jgi:hypothetical protein
LVEHLPLLTHLYDEPSRFDTLEAWEQYLIDLRSLRDSVARRLDLSRAERILAEMRSEKKT